MQNPDQQVAPTPNNATPGSNDDVPAVEEVHQEEKQEQITTNDENQENETSTYDEILKSVNKGAAVAGEYVSLAVNATAEVMKPITEPMVPIFNTIATYITDTSAKVADYVSSFFRTSQ